MINHKTFALICLIIAAFLACCGCFFLGRGVGRMQAEMSDVRLTVETDSNQILIVDGDGQRVGSLTRTPSEKFQGDVVLMRVQAKTK